MYDINSYKRAVIEKTNLCNDKDYLMRYIERLHYLNKVDLIELEKLPFDEWINEIEDEDNRELFKLLPYLSLHKAFEKILDEMPNRVKECDAMEGSFIYTALAPFAMELTL